MRSMAVAAAAAHSSRVGNSRGNFIRMKFIKRGEKIFSRRSFSLIVSGQIAEI